MYSLFFYWLIKIITIIVIIILNSIFMLLVENILIIFKEYLNICKHFFKSIILSGLRR